MSRNRPIHGLSAAPLNFKIVAYADEAALLAASPAENVIGVITHNKMTGWMLSSEEPEIVEGLIWVFTGTTSRVAFNALKKNGIMVYPIKCYQAVGGVWVDVTAKSYQGGEWADWWNGELYVDGDQFEDITGGWWNNTGLYWGQYPNGGGELTFGEYLTVPAATNKTNCATTKNKIDLTTFDQLTFVLAEDSSTPPTTSVVVMVHALESGDLKDNYVAGSSDGVISLTGVSGEYYITVLSVNGRTMKAGDIRLT